MTTYDPPVPASPLSVLIIDDCEDEHTLYREFLEDGSQSYRFLDAYNGAEGERLYRQNEVDCVLLDYRLPDIDGLEVLRRLAADSDGGIIPAIMLTGEGNEAVAVIAMKQGSQDYLPKNVLTSQALKRTIHHAVERSRLTRRMEQYRKELERSNSDLERFVSVAAHDLKSPLRAVSQHLTIITERNRDKLDEKSLVSLNFAIDGAKRMSKLIDALFEFSRAGFDHQTFAPVDCNAMLDAVRANLQISITESGARITSDRLPMIDGNAMQIMQLLQNLIGNAIKFCDRTPQIHVSSRRVNSTWELQVSDNGIGIPPEARDSVFTIFRRLHSESRYPGCGIGLAICERVVKNHGGVIHIESNDDGGSSFCFTLPASADTEGKAA